MELVLFLFLWALLGCPVSSGTPQWSFLGSLWSGLFVCRLVFFADSVEWVGYFVAGACLSLMWLWVAGMV